MTELTLEQLRFAREIGATHSCVIAGILIYLKEESRDTFIQVMSYIDDRWKDVTGCPTVIKNPLSCVHCAVKINFAPLDEAEQPEQQASKMHAADFLQCGINHMRDREKTYDAAGGERSIGKTVAMFNSLYDLELTEQQGWAFMCLLKIVRTSQGAFRSDNYEDLAAYAGLMGESAQELGK